MLANFQAFNFGGPDLAVYEEQSEHFTLSNGDGSMLSSQGSHGFHVQGVVPVANTLAASRLNQPSLQSGLPIPVRRSPVDLAQPFMDAKSIEQDSHLYAVDRQHHHEEYSQGFSSSKESLFSHKTLNKVTKNDKFSVNSEFSRTFSRAEGSLRVRP